MLHRDRRRPAAGSDFSAGPRVTEPSLDATLRPANLNNDPSPTDRPAPGKRASRSLARFLATACIGVAATLAWQSYGGAAMQMIASTVPQLGWLLAPPATNPPSGREIAVEQPSPPAAAASAPQAASAQAAAVAPAASETVASSAPAVPAPELQQLATMAHDLAACGECRPARRRAAKRRAARRRPGADGARHRQAADRRTGNPAQGVGTSADRHHHRAQARPAPATSVSVISGAASAPAAGACTVSRRRRSPLRPPEPPLRPPMPVR